MMCWTISRAVREASFGRKSSADSGRFFTSSITPSRVNVHATSISSSSDVGFIVMAVTSLLLFSLRALGRFLFPPCAGENALQAVVRLVTRELVDPFLGLHDRIRHGPRPRPRRRILQGKAVFEGIGVEARETLDQMQIRARPAEGRFVREVDR